MNRLGIALAMSAWLFSACESRPCSSNTMQNGQCAVSSDTGSVAGARVVENPSTVGALRANGEGCSADADCASSHCRGVCCAAGSDCCRTVADCTTLGGGLGMVCEVPAQCRGVAGKLTCSTDFRCMVVTGARNDAACDARIEANECGPYPSVYCSGQPEQAGPPACATSCKSDADCDLDAHCADGKCVPDLPNGEPCKGDPDCTQGFCKNIQNGLGVCCGAALDCCKLPSDCPAKYREAATCSNQSCTGSEIVAECTGNACSSKKVMNDAVCAGVMGPSCGLYKDVICKAGADNRCASSCSSASDCDANAFCDAGRCVAKRGTGEMCDSPSQCMSSNCTNDTCCSANQECCKNAEQCARGLDLRCDQSGESMVCQGTRHMATCESSVCVYSTGRIPDDRGCKTGGSRCGNFKDVSCNGEVQQWACLLNCASSDDCDAGFICGDAQGQQVCKRP